MFNYDSRFWLPLLLTVSLLDHASTQTSIGDGCSTSEGAGVCQLADQCPSAYNRLRSGDWLEIKCGYHKDDTPIVCCLSQIPPPLKTTTPWTWAVVTPTVTKRPANPPSRQKCAEYERSFFGQMIRKRSIPLQVVPEGPVRVTNGTEAKAKEFPHMAAIGYDMGSEITWDCGGTLISDRFVLTAAHCTISPQWGDAKWVRLGSIVNIGGNDEFQPRRIMKRIRHPNYKRPLQYNDIALLMLERPVTFSDYIMPACLDNKENYPAGKLAVATGWGLTVFNEENSRSASLLKVELSIVAHSNCAFSYSDDADRLPYGIDDHSQICAGENEKDTCQGDSGGPLIVKTGKSLTFPRVVGITSFGLGCGLGSPGVYTRVSYYVPWIEGIVWPDELM